MIPEVKERVAPGTHSSVFREFYNSECQCLVNKYGDNKSATNAQAAMLNLMNRERIYDVRIIRKKNILRLLKPGAYQRTREYRDQIMERFLRKE